MHDLQVVQLGFQRVMGAPFKQAFHSQDMKHLLSRMQLAVAAWSGQRAVPQRHLDIETRTLIPGPGHSKSISLHHHMVKGLAASLGAADSNTEYCYLQRTSNMAV